MLIATVRAAVKPLVELNM